MIRESDLRILNQEIAGKITGEEELSHSKALGGDLFFYRKSLEFLNALLSSFAVESHLFIALSSRLICFIKWDESQLVLTVFGTTCTT